MKLKVEIEHDWIYVDNVKVGCLQWSCREIQFIQQLVDKGIVEKVHYRISSSYLGDLTEQTTNLFNIDKWHKYKYDL